MLTVGELRKWIEDQDDDKRVAFWLDGHQLEVCEAYGLPTTYTIQMEESI
jgi:hypothetical protein